MSIVLEPTTHTYRDGDREYVAVSRVIDAVMKKSFEGVDPDVLANAADRGQKTERYCEEILRTGGCSIPAGERQDVTDRVAAFYHWYQQKTCTLIDAQRIVSSEADGIAGCLDFLLEDIDALGVVDLKCTSQPEKSWALQIGAYMTYCPEAQFCAILHLNPKYKNGWIWREYDPLIVKSQWASALNWYRTLQSLKAD